VQHRQPGEQLGVQPVGLAVLGVVPRQIRRAPPAEPGRRRAPWRRNQAASGTHALRVGPITTSTSAGSVPSEPWSTDRPGSAATCRNLAGPDVPARSSATTDVVRGATRDIDAEANRHCELPSDDCQEPSICSPTGRGNQQRCRADEQVHRAVVVGLQSRRQRAEDQAGQKDLIHGVSESWICWQPRCADVSSCNCDSRADPLARCLPDISPAHDQRVEDEHVDSHYRERPERVLAAPDEAQLDDEVQTSDDDREPLCPAPACDQRSACQRDHEAPDQHDLTPSCEGEDDDLLWRQNVVVVSDDRDQALPEVQNADHNHQHAGKEDPACPETPRCHVHISFR
jgi:hypothetical protein